MPRANKSATLSTLIFDSFRAASQSGTESVTTTSVIADFRSPLDRRPGKNRMRAGRINFRGAFLQQRLRRLHHGPAVSMIRP